MKPRVRFILAGVIILIVLKLFVFRAYAQQNPGVGDQLPAGKIYGEALLTTNAIEYGLTQTDKSFGFQTGFGYRWTQFKTGIWGSNVRYPGSDDNLNLRLYGAYKFIFTSNADLTARYDFNRYYKAGDRNGSLMGIDLNLFQYHILLDTNDNWEGTKTSRMRFGFMKDWPIPWNMNLNVNAGYNMVSASGYSNYFDVKTQAQYKWADLTYSIGHSYASNAGQFGGAGDMAFFLSAAAQF